jgi:PAS domain S-box-containing protein
MMDSAGAAKLQAVFELSPTILTVTGLDDGRIVEVNDAFLLATGYSRDEVIGRLVPEIAVWVDPAQREAGLAALRAGRSIRNVEARFRAKSGREIVAITNADIVVIDGRACILTALVDITDRVRAEGALRESERRFAQLFHANALPTTIVSMRTYRHLDVNEAAVRHSGYTREEMLGRTKPELGFWVASDQRDDLLHQLLARGQARDFEVTFRTKTGEERQLLTNSEVITYEGEPAVLSVSVDITERKHLEAQREARREEAETLTRTKDEFLAILSHELRNPLGAITHALGVLDRLASSGDLRKRGRHHRPSDRSPHPARRRPPGRRAPDSGQDRVAARGGRPARAGGAMRARAPRSRPGPGASGRRRGSLGQRHRRSRAPRAGDQQPPRQRAQVHGTRRRDPPDHGPSRR